MNSVIDLTGSPRRDNNNIIIIISLLSPEIIAENALINLITPTHDFDTPIDAQIAAVALEFGDDEEESNDLIINYLLRIASDWRERFESTGKMNKKCFGLWWAYRRAATSVKAETYIISTRSQAQRLHGISNGIGAELVAARLVADL